MMIQKIIYIDSQKVGNWDDCYTIRVPQNSNGQDLLPLLYAVLGFKESETEESWLNFKDVIENFWWVNEETVVFFHEDVSSISQKDLINYLWLIEHVEEYNHKLRFVFNESDKYYVGQCLKFVAVSSIIDEIYKIWLQAVHNKIQKDTIQFIDLKRESIRVGSGVYIIPRVNNKTELFEQLNRLFSFPYFGCNWDSLDELYRDFHWIKERQITVIHEDVSRLSDVDLAVYIKIINSSLKFWNSCIEHSVNFVFDMLDKDIVYNAIKNV